VLVVGRIHCEVCRGYHDVCLDCAEQRSERRPEAVDLRAASADLLGSAGPDQLGIFAVGAREAILVECVRTVSP
jgi:hypothetical protein